MSRIAERPCPNCGARNSLQVDASRGEVACEECAVVIASGLEEDEETRYVKDVVFADVDESTRGGAGGAVISKTREETQSSRVDFRIRRLVDMLREKTGSPEATVHRALDIYRRHVAYANRRGDPVSWEAFCLVAFHLASCQERAPVPIKELLRFSDRVKLLDARRKLTECRSALDITDKFENFERDLLRRYVPRLGWSLAAMERPVMTVLEAMTKIVELTLSPEDKVVAGCLLVRLSPAVQARLSRAGFRGAFTIQEGEAALMQLLASVTRWDEKDIEKIYHEIRKFESVIVTSLPDKPVASTPTDTDGAPATVQSTQTAIDSRKRERSE